MNLTAQILTPLLFGTEAVEETADGICVYHFTSEERDLYRDISDYYAKLCSAAGIRFSARTDADELCFDYTLLSGSSRAYGYFDVYVNGVMTDHFGLPDNSNCRAHAGIPLPPGINSVEIYFPWSKQVVLSDWQAKNCGLLEPLPRRRTMLHFGDSITQGYDALYPSLSFSSRLAKLLDADCINKGIGGERFVPALLDKAVPRKPDLVVLSYGTNDWNVSLPSVFRKKCRHALTIAEERFSGAAIFLTTPIWRADWNKTTQFGADAHVMAEEIRAIAKDFPTMHVIDAWDAVPHCPAFFSDAYLHPNDLCFTLYAENIYRLIAAELSANR